MGNKITFEQKLLNKGSNHLDDCFCQYCTNFEILKNRGLVKSRWIDPNTNLFSPLLLCIYEIKGSHNSQKIITFVDQTQIKNTEVTEFEIRDCIKLIEKYIQLKGDSFNNRIQLTFKTGYMIGGNGDSKINTIICNDPHNEIVLLNELLHSTIHKIPLINRTQMKIVLQENMNLLNIGDSKNLSKKIAEFL
jgi:hypothetical protein